MLFTSRERDALHSGSLISLFPLHAHCAIFFFSTIRFFSGIIYFTVMDTTGAPYVSMYTYCLLAAAALFVCFHRRRPSRLEGGQAEQPHPNINYRTFFFFDILSAAEVAGAIFLSAICCRYRFTSVSARCLVARRANGEREKEKKRGWWVRGKCWQ